MTIIIDGGLEIEVKCRINDVGKVLGGMKVFSCRAIGMNVKRRLYEGLRLTGKSKKMRNKSHSYIV